MRFAGRREGGWECEKRESKEKLWGLVGAEIRRRMECKRKLRTQWASGRNCDAKEIKKSGR
jgi:hypothetical protein